MPPWSGTGLVSLQIEISYVMFKEGEMERKFWLRDMEDDVLVYFSRDPYFCLSRTAQNQGQESTILRLPFLSKAEQVLLVFSLLVVSR